MTEAKKETDGGWKKREKLMEAEKVRQMERMRRVK